MALSCIISEIEILLKNCHFFILQLHSTPRCGDASPNIAITFGMAKLEWWVYQTVKKHTPHDITGSTMHRVESHSKCGKWQLLQDWYQILFILQQKDVIFSKITYMCSRCCILCHS